MANPLLIGGVSILTIDNAQLGSNRDIGMNETYVSCQYLHTLVEKVDQR